VSDGESKVCNDAAAVSPHQDILGLDVPVGDGGLALRPKDLRVQGDQARDRGNQDPHGFQLKAK